MREKAEQLYAKGSYALSLDFYNAAYQQSVKENNPLWTANLLLDISAVKYLSADYRQCVDLVSTGLRLLEKKKIHSDSTFFKLWSGLGEYYHQLSMVDSSLYFFSKADNLLEQNENLSKSISEYVVFHFGNQALAHRSLGRYTQGIVLASRGLELATNTQNTAAIGLLQNVLADQYEKTGEYEKAFQLRLKALNSYPNEDQKKARIYSGLGINSVYRGDYQNALKYLNNAVGLMSRAASSDNTQKNKRYLADIYNVTAHCLLMLKKFDLATEKADKALNIISPSPGRADMLASRSYLLKGIAASGGPNRENEEEYYNSAWSYVISSSSKKPLSGFEMTAVSILKAKGEKYMREGRFTEALTVFENALDCYHTARQHLFSMDDKLYLGNSILSLYNNSLETAYQVYDQKRDNRSFKRAFRIANQNHALILKDAMSEAEKRPMYLPPPLLRKEDSLKRELLTLQLLSQTTEGPSNTHIEKLSIVQQSYSSVLREIQNSYLAYYQARFLPPDEEPERLMSMLDGETALLSYAYTHGRLHLFALTNQRYTWKTVKIDSSVVSIALRNLRESALIHPGIREYKGSQYAIDAFDWFIRPVLSDISNKKKWVIQSGGLLQGVPVEIFETGRKTGDYVAINHRIRYIYTTMSLSSRANTNLGSPRVVAIAPFTAEPASGLLSNLPWSKKEAETIAPDYHYLSQRANKANLLESLEKADVLHMATHVVPNVEAPLLSYLALKSDEKGQDRWYGSEISGSNLQHLRLAVLSACEAGKGRYLPMEGIISLARCFAYAGCPQLITSLTGATVDQATALWMEIFYNHLKKGLPPSEALFLARQDFLRNPLARQYNHPFFWANFIQIGEDTPVYPPPNHSLQNYIIFWVLVLVSVFLVFQFRKRFRYALSKP